MNRFHTIVWLLIAMVAVAEPHYLERYHPVVIYPMDQPVDTEKLSDGSGQFAASIHNAGKGDMPTLIDGARPFLGKAWDFEGVRSSFVSQAGEDVHRLGDIDSTKGLSVSFWMRSDWHSRYNNHRIMGKHGIDITMAKGQGTGSVHFHAGDYSISVEGSDKQDLFDEQWHHVLFAVDFTSSESNVVAYVDGREVARGSGFANRSFNSNDPRDRVVIGARSNRSYPFNGQLDDVAFFDYALTPSQVAGICAGPVFAGLDQTIYLPNTASLGGIAPEGNAVTWSKHAGPGDVAFLDASKPQTTATFSVDGSYVLMFAVAGYQPQTVKMQVRPPAPPFVIASDPIQIKPPGNSVALQGRVSLPGRDDLEGVTFIWTQIEGAGSVTFRDASSLATTVQFSEPGLYRLRLSADANGMSEEDDVTVLIGETAPRHYAQLLNPLYLFTLDQPANRESAGITDQVEGTCAELVKSDKRLPQLAHGARPFTGSAWDFSRSTASVKTHNRFNVAQLGNLDSTRGLSFSFWFRGDSYSRRMGRIAGSYSLSLDIQPTPVSKTEGGLQVSLLGAMLHSTREGDQRNLFDGDWHHTAIVVDLHGTQDNLRLYVDGRLHDSASKAFTENVHNVRTDQGTFWGARLGAGEPFVGQLDDIAAFAYPLSEDDIAYLVNGPTDKQMKLLQQPDIRVEAGKDQILELPARRARLTGKAGEGSDLTYQWELVTGPGAVSFSSPQQAQTEVTFGPLNPIINPDYREYVFRLSAAKHEGVARWGGEDEVSIIFHSRTAPATRELSKVPPPGVHPRILFSPEDLPGMRARASSDPYAAKAMELMRARCERDLFNPNSPSGYVYQQLKTGDPDVSVKLQVGDGVGDVYNYSFGNGQFYGKMCGAAFLALIDDDPAKATELAIVLANCATAQLAYYRPNYGSYLTHDASGALGLAYDFLHGTMSEEQRRPVRQLLSMMTRWRQSMGTGQMSPDNSTNWRTFHDHIVIAALAIEGEEGYDPQVYRQSLHKLRDFLTQYGVFRSGYAHEGWGYFNFGMTSGSLSALAAARRDENLWETTNLYSSLLAQYRSLVPGQNWVFGHGDIIAGKLASPGNILWVGRYLWPSDPAISHLGTTLADNLLTARDQRGLHMMAALFAVGPKPAAQSLKSASEALGLPLTLFCPDKGYVNTRSDWSDEALLLTFRCRMDKYFLGHMHPDVNSFELFAKGHEWFTDPGKYLGPNDFHQTVLIDGVGGGGSAGAWTWPSLPGRFVEFKDTELMTLGSGDAKVFYDYVYSKPTTGTRVERFEFPAIKDHGLLWADFLYQRTREDALPAWRMKPVGYSFHYHNQSPLYQYNPVQRACRTAALVRGEHPFVLIVDDYQKDDERRDYQWVANCRVGTVEQVSSNETDLILKPKTKKDDGARLLVRVLQADGQGGAPQFEEKESFSGPESDMPSARVLIDARGVVSPNLKVLLYPFKVGDPMPTVSGNTISIGDQIRRLSFTHDQDERTRIDVTE